MRCAHKERNTMFASSSWAGSMLAAQGNAGDVAVGEAED